MCSKFVWHISKCFFFFRSPWVIKSIQVVAGEDKGTIYSSKRQIDVLADNSFSCGKLVVDLYTKDKDGKFESKKGNQISELYSILMLLCPLLK